MSEKFLTKAITYETFKKEVLNDYRIISISRHASLIGRKEVLSGKAKFGIFGDGKELPQIAMAKVFEKGDFRSGYYRDQTFMLAIDKLNIKQIFSALYANTDINEEPMSAGRQMGSHFSTPFLNDDGSFMDLTKQFNSSSDISPTSGQMPRLLGLAMASKLYRSGKFNSEKHSVNGNEIAWGTIGNASTSEGLFFEVINAAGVHQVPMIVNIWDDEFGISVDNSYQTIKSSISEALKGFETDGKKKGFELIRVKGWDYPKLISAYEHASNICREKHIPVIIHVIELTQPLGHSTSGSHERYKNKKRLDWEKKYDCNLMMRNWIIENGISTDKELKLLEKESFEFVNNEKNNAWRSFQNTLKNERLSLLKIIKSTIEKTKNNSLINLYNQLSRIKEPTRKDILSHSRKSLRIHDLEKRDEIINWIKKYKKTTQPLYSSFLYNEHDHSIENINEVKPLYDDKSHLVDGRVILKNNFDKLLDRYKNLVIFGEDSGKIGGVNQALEGLQEKYGNLKVDDRGIREASIVGEGIGLALRGFRPIAEIQYLDYLLFALQTLSDDLATMSYRTVGKQISPLIIRTRGHRLEGIWHSGSPIGMLVNSLKGIRILVPRNMVQAAGMYNSLLKSFEPAIVIEPLNSYRLKEKEPTNYGDFGFKIGKVNFIRQGSDITIVSYGSTLRIVDKACDLLKEHDINVDLIDIQSIIPFDVDNEIVKSLKLTNKLMIVDEDLPGGASSYILHKILEINKGYDFLDSKPITLTAKEHRPPYGSDGDYYSKPSIDDVFETVYKLMQEYNPTKYGLKLS